MGIFLDIAAVHMYLFLADKMGEDLIELPLGCMQAEQVGEMMARSVVEQLQHSTAQVAVLRMSVCLVVEAHVAMTAVRRRLLAEIA